MIKYCFIMFFGLFFSACDRSKDSLPGIYVNHSAGSYSIAFDTLVILAENENTFSIERKVSFIKIRHEVFQSKEYHLEHWLAVYDDKTKVLTEIQKGKTLMYVPGKKKLYLGNSSYIKI